MNKVFHLLACLFLAGATLLPVTSRSARAQSRSALVVLISATSGLKDISSALLRRTFQGYPAEYASGKRLIPFNQPAGDQTRAAFDRAVLGLEPNEVGLFWVDQRIRSASEPPRTLPSLQLAARVVASLPGAISYTTSDFVSDKVRVLTIDGKGPTDPAYLLRR